MLLVVNYTVSECCHRADLKGQVNAGTSWPSKDVEYFPVAPTVGLADLNLVSSSFTLVPKASVTFTASAGMTVSRELHGLR